MRFHLEPVPHDHRPKGELAWPAVDDEVLRSLPPLLRGVVSALGFMRARQFLSDQGGVRVTIPRGFTSRLGLTEDELMRLCNALAHHLDTEGKVWLPKADKLFVRARDTQIRRDRCRMSIAELARAHNLTARHILNICREDDDRQIDLF